MWVIPALYPRKAVRWTGFFGSSCGKRKISPDLSILLLARRNREGM